jgi:hypothetical protein
MDIEAMENIRSRSLCGPDGLRVESSITDSTKAAVLLGDQHRVTVGEQRDAPGMDEA